MHALLQLSACELSRAIHTGQVSCRDVMSAYLARIHLVNPRFNAIVSLQPEQLLLEQADRCDAQLATGHSQGWMQGFPMAIKDLADTAGVTTTFGSPLFANHLPGVDCTMVARMKAAGGIVIGKTNTAEFGLGSHTFNTPFGSTGNAWDPAFSAGGSSGGAAVSLALRMQPVADGSDMMGSLRNPAAFNHVFGLRPSPGRVPRGPAGEAFVSQLSTEGPMARHVGDLAMLLSVQAGRDANAPLSLPGDGSEFSGSLRPAGLQGRRIGWLGTLEGHLPIEPGILDVCESGLARLVSLGCHVEPVSLGFPPDLVWQAWLTLRHWQVAATLAAAAPDATRRLLLKPEAAWELAAGERLTAREVLAASQQRTAFYRHVLTLFERFDFLVLPAAQVWPFPVARRWPDSIAGVAMDTYHRWMEVVIYASLAGLPTISMPVGFNAAGLPMGMQLMGPPLADMDLLRLAAAYETSIGELLDRRPPG